MNTEINFAGIKMKNPVTVASGTFGYGREYSDFFDLSKLGGIITKGTSLKPRSGNKPPRVCETASGMLNSIGLQNPGVEYFAENDLLFLRKFDTAIIVNACGSTIDEYVELCKILNTTHLEPDILEYEVKWALGSITKNKASGGEEIPAKLF